MNARMTRMLSLCYVVFYLLSTSISAAELPTVEEVLETYRANCQKLSTMHLRMVHTNEETEASRKTYRRQAEQSALAIKSFADGAKIPQPWAGQMTREQFLQMLRQQAEFSRSMSESTPVESFSELFIDGENYQVRTPRSLQVTMDANWTFPAIPVTSKSLGNEYARIRIYSRSAESDPVARIWPGQPDPDSTVYAMLSSQHVWESQVLRLPPLTGKLDAPWDTRHPIDAFFHADADRYRVIGTESQDGRLLTIVDAVVVTDLQNVEVDAKGIVVTDENGKPKMWTAAEFYRTWIDLERGALPIKMHYWHGREGKSVEERAQYHPYRIITTKQIEKLDNGAYYPTISVQEEYRDDPDTPQPKTIEDWEKFRAEKKRLPQVVHERKTWNCFLIESKFPHDDEFFVLDFPEGVEFFDLDTEKVIGALERKPPVKPGQPAPPLQVAQWLDGEKRSLEDFRGKVVFLDFWGLWCSACRNSVPQLKLLQEKYKHQPVVFISIHTAERDQQNLVRRIKEYTEKQDWQFLAAIDKGTMIENSPTVNDYGVRGFPGTVVIGADGVVRFNTDIPPKGMEDIRGNLELTAEQEARYTAYVQKQYEAAGVEWLENEEELSKAERDRRSAQVFLFQFSQPIDAALKDAGLLKE